MNCKESKQLIDAGRLSQPSVELTAHLQSCHQCRELAGDWQLQQAFKQFPTPKARAGFAAEAMHRAWQEAGMDAQKRATPRYSWAAAAMVVISVGFLYNSTQTPTTPTTPTVQPPTVASTSSPGQATATFPSGLVENDLETSRDESFRADALRDDTSRNIQPAIEVAAVPDLLRSLHLKLETARALTDATIQLAWSDQLQLVGYDQQQSLRWKTSLQAGNNGLTLPIKLHSKEAGELVVTVISGEAAKAMTISVNADQSESPDGLVDQLPGTLPRVAPRTTQRAVHRSIQRTTRRTTEGNQPGSITLQENIIHTNIII